MKTLIKSQKGMRHFLDFVLPELKNDEVFTVILAARKKYSSLISRSSEMLDKLIIKTNDIDRIICKLRKFGAVEKVYTDYNTGDFIPLEPMVMYIDLHPKSIIKALSFYFHKEVDEMMYNSIASNDFDLKQFRKVDTKLFSAISRSSDRKIYAILDFDAKDIDFLRDILDLKGIAPIWITETRGGYHAIFNYSKEVARSVYELSSEHSKVEMQHKTALTPIVGTLQGGFRVRKYLEDIE